MAQNKSFDTTKRKRREIWNQTEKNRIDISVNTDNRNFKINQINETIPKTHTFSRFADVSLDWAYFNISQEEAGVTKEIYKTWSIELPGLTLNQVSAVKHSFMFRFGNGTILNDSNIEEDTTLWQINYASLKNDILTFYYGILIADNAGITEFDDNGLQVKLNLRIFNPSFYL